MTMELSLPDVANPCPAFSASAVPCAPLMPVISPMSFAIVLVDDHHAALARDEDAAGGRSGTT